METRKRIQVATIVDIDGTLAIRNGRGPYEWDRVGEDLRHNPVIDIVNAWQDHMAHMMTTIFVSGRKEQCRTQTIEWLNRHMSKSCQHVLHMRADNDNREDHIFKQEIYDTYIKPNYHVLAVFDDRQQVVDMWRRNGLTCLQVAEGNF
jgi:hypothetical protein